MSLSRYFGACAVHNPVGACGERMFWECGAKRDAARSTHSAIDVGLGPHRVMLLVDHLGSAQHVEILHHVLLHICQRGNLSEVACWAEGHRRV